MKLYVLLGLLTMLLFALALVAQNTPVSETAQTSMMKTYPGFLSDAQCGMLGKDPDGNNLQEMPWKHTTACMKLPGCAASGYGMYIKTDKGMYKYYKFDPETSAMVKKDIMGKTKRKDNNYVLAKGSVEPNGEFKAEWVKEMKNSKMDMSRKMLEAMVPMKN